jgi:hypothetical protein
MTWYCPDELFMNTLNSYSPHLAITKFFIVVKYIYGVILAFILS